MVRRSTTEQLKTLDNFQRAEFLKRKRIYSECRDRINGLRAQTRSLDAKKEADSKAWDKLHILFLIFIFVAFVLLVFFDRSEIEKNTYSTLVVIVWAGGFIIKAVIKGHDSMVFEMFVLEISRFESELRIIGLQEYISDDDLTKCILESLGFDVVRIASRFNTSPLDPSE